MQIPVADNMASDLRNQLPSREKGLRFPGGVVKPNRSWFALVTFCAATTIIVALAFAIFFASATVAFAVAHTVSPLVTGTSKAVNDEAKPEPSAPSGETFAGLITDDRCGARHDMGSAKSPAECAQACVRNGAKFALVDGDKTYALEGDSEEVARFSGQRVSLVGSLLGGTIQVSSVASNE